MSNADVQLDSSFVDAFRYALELHGQQRRKGSGIPYIAHLLAVAALVLEDGGDQDQAIAALLHDAVEDQGGLQTLESIEARFGPCVAKIVEQCSDTMETPKPPWKHRKEAYLEMLVQADQAVIRVSIADKVHNLRSIYHDYLLQGEALWSRFRGGKEGTLWYYHALLDIYESRSTSWMVEELRSILGRLEKLLLQEISIGGGSAKRPSQGRYR